MLESSVEAIGALDAEAGSWEASARERRNVGEDERRREMRIRAIARVA